MKKIECEDVGDNDGFFELEVKASPIEPVVMLQYLHTIKANAMCEAVMDFLKMIGIALCVVVPFIIFAT